MKRKLLIGASAVCVLLVVAIACKRNFNDGFDARGTSAGNGPFKGTVTLPRVIASSRTLSKDTLYILDGKTYVDSGAVLTIQAGGRIQAKRKASSDSASALIITRTAKLNAEGTSGAPIHFTSNEASPAPGDWGGIVLLGRAPLNRPDTTIEGINLPTVPASIDVNYGGGGRGLGDPMDCSGKLTYCIIEYPGTIISPDNELNGLTCGGVGAGTVLDFIEVYRGNDDAFEFFGGTVNAKHLFAFEPDDDAFDFDFGYTGEIQYAVSILTAGALTNYSANPNGVESDNNATGADSLPYTHATISNMTVIGLVDSTTAATKGLFNGMHARRRSSYTITNSIAMGFPGGLRLDAVISPDTVYRNSLLHAFKDTLLGSALPFNLNSTVKKYRTFNANADIKLHAPFNYAGLDFRPDTVSPAITWPRDFSGLPSTAAGGACSAPAWSFTTTSPTYIGAFGVYSSLSAGINNWLFGWARMI